VDAIVGTVTGQDVSNVLKDIVVGQMDVTQIQVAIQLTVILEMVTFSQEALAALHNEAEILELQIKVK
jgi:hypothetical protein